MTLQIDKCPWRVPVPVEKGRFVPLFQKDAALNIQVAPLPVYGSQTVPYPADSLLHADLQTPLYAHLAGRLGSGRAGFYRGRYLKGVGRTPLAANWNHTDNLHNSGHLTASSAVREFVVSLYLKEQGCAASIVPCDGILFAELAPALRNYHENLYANTPAGHVPPIDQHLQAVTAKPGIFARQSNFVWLLHHLSPPTAEPGDSSLGTFCELLAAALTPPGEEVVPGDITPASLASLLNRAVHLALERFRLWFEKGVWWGSFNNNFTIDGRFLDLETPALLGGPCIGHLSTAGSGSARSLNSTMIGLEQFSFIAQTRAFCAELCRVLGHLPRYFCSVEREFAGELAAEIDAQILAPDRILGSRDEAIRAVLSMIESVFGQLSTDDHAMVRRVVETDYAGRVGHDTTMRTHNESTGRFSPVPGFPYLVTEPGRRWRPHALTLESGRLLGPSEEHRRVACHLAEVISDLDQTTSLSSLLDKLAVLSKSEHLTCK